VRRVEGDKMKFFPGEEGDRIIRAKGDKIISVRGTR